MRSSRLSPLLAGAVLLAACGGDGSGPSNATPTAAFTVQCDQLDCTFNNGSTDSDGTLDAYAWGFGDNSAQVTTRDAVHTYAAPGGQFTVTLTVTDDHGDTATATDQVIVSEANVPPTAGFSFVCPNLGCDFTDQSFDRNVGGWVASYRWTFGDGQASSEKNPVHTYTVAGTYTVALTVTDNLGETGNVSQQVTVTAPTPLTVDFSVTCSSLVCTFTNESTGDFIAGWFWDFGDGDTSQDQNPDHVYDVTEPTTFTVTLTVMNWNLDVGVASHDINVAPPGARFPAGEIRGQIK